MATGGRAAGSEAERTKGQEYGTKLSASRKGVTGDGGEARWAERDGGNKGTNVPDATEAPKEEPTEADEEPGNDEGKEPAMEPDDDDEEDEAATAEPREAAAASTPAPGTMGAEQAMVSEEPKTAARARPRGTEAEAARSGE